MTFFIYILFIYSISYSLSQDIVFNFIRKIKLLKCIKCTSYWVTLIALFIFDYKPFYNYIIVLSDNVMLTEVLYYITYPIVMSHFILLIYEAQYLLLDKKADL